MSTGDTTAQLDAVRPLSKPKKPLSCISCKVRKLKCDHERPACSRCAKANSECIYPEARRKPKLLQTNVKELEARIAQVEGYLKEVGQSRLDTSRDILVSGLDSQDWLNSKDQHGTEKMVEDDAAFHDLSTLPGNSAVEDQLFSQNVADDGTAQAGPQLLSGLADLDSQAGSAFHNNQLIDLGMSEALPPPEMVEDLHTAFFSTQYHYMPAIHSGRYYRAFYGNSLSKPPMCLQYAIWAMGALWHPKYDRIADVFYKRARHYAETDELKGDGEHFITIAHAQTWVLIAAYEARAMLYTRASMSGARGARLVQMMALDEIDAPDGMLSPPRLAPPSDWTELEERRRVFWMAFLNDAQGSIATGWNSIIRTKDIMTRLPASEEAFASGQEENAPFLDEVMKGAPYSGFTGSLVINEMLKSIMSHVHLIKSSDRPEDAINGAFWQRHRRLDNQLSTLFLFMPESFRLPENIRDPLATYINLNFHACVICLHHVALEKIETHGLDDRLRKECRSLLKNAAEEIASIAKLTSHRSSLFSNPLCAFSLYCATTVYVYLAKQEPSSGINPKDMSNLELIINVMEAISRIHMITSAFLQQACLDIDKNGLSGIIKLPNLYQYRDLFGGPASSIPLMARSPISKHTQMSSPLPGRLPLDKPLGHLRPMNIRMTKSVPLLTGVTAAMSRLDITDCFRPSMGAISRNLEPRSTENRHKRKRQLSTAQLSTHISGESVGEMGLPKPPGIAHSTHPPMNSEREQIEGGSHFLSQTNPSSFAPLPLGEAGSSEVGPGASHGVAKEADMSRYQSHTPLTAWQSIDNETLAFSATTADIPDGEW
ncbi:hypothetical protein CCMA1212_009320 [Trichoderma ghanense]|uniref:Zn(2)-C6 fungal-type domain-containing protein n=1 Tax=Trichoderma ghanense TaxID=65468 RepID=A0ABY2GU09_9HYPO